MNPYAPPQDPERPTAKRSKLLTVLAVLILEALALGALWWVLSWLQSMANL